MIKQDWTSNCLCLRSTRSHCEAKKKKIFQIHVISLISIILTSRVSKLHHSELMRYHGRLIPTSYAKCDEIPGLVRVTRLFDTGIPVSSRSHSNFHIQSRSYLGLDRFSKPGIASFGLASTIPHFHFEN